MTSSLPEDLEKHPEQENSSEMNEVVLDPPKEDKVASIVFEENLVEETDERPFKEELTDPNEVDKPIWADNIINSKLVKKYIEPSGTVEQAYQVCYEIEHWNGDVEVIALAPMPIREVEKILEDSPKVGVLNTEEGKLWLNNITASAYNVVYRNGYLDSLKREGSQWRQFVKSDNGVLQPSVVKIKTEPGAVPTGERALYLFKAARDLGRLIQIPLWHSGFWVTLKAPTESALLNLFDTLIEQRTNLGRTTYGLIFSHAGVTAAEHIYNFVMDHLYSTTAKVEDIRKVIKVHDLPLLVWGMACTIWPKGWQYIRPIFGDDKEPLGIVKQRVQIGRLIWTDTSQLTQWQKNLMGRRTGEVTQSELERYQSEFVNMANRTVKIDDNIQFELKCPTIDEYIISGQQWIQEIVDMFETVAGEDVSEKKRNEFIDTRAKANFLRYYGHWVKALHMSGGVYEDRETLDMLLNEASTDTEIRNTLRKEIEKYIDDTVVSLIAVPTEDVTEVKYPRFPHLLPLDPIACFFTQLVQRANKIQNR